MISSIRLISVALTGVVVALAACSASAPNGVPTVARSTVATTDPVTVLPGSSTTSRPAPSTSAAASKPDAVPDACTLLSRAQAEQLVKVTLRPGEDHRAANSQGIASCSYDAPVTGTTASVQIYAQNGTPNALVDDRTQGGHFTSVRGIADQTLDEPGANSIFVRKGTLWLYINIPYGTTATTLIRAARLAAARLR